jgi:hypothetical protein
MRAIRLFIAEEERGGGKASAAKEERQRPAVAGWRREEKIGGLRAVEQISPVVWEEEFAKQPRLARYLAGASLPAMRTLEPAAQRRTLKPAKAVPKARTGAKKETPKQKAGEVELAKERRRVGRVSRQKTPSSGSHPSEKGRGSPGR